MKIDARRVSDVLIIDMIGNRLDSLAAGAMEGCILDTVQDEDRRVVLNLERLAYISSAGLRVILRVGRLLQANRGELKICNARGLVRDVLETSGFHSLIKMYDTEKEAFAAFLV
jgi:anti-anti-sigma factor